MLSVVAVILQLRLDAKSLTKGSLMRNVFEDGFEVSMYLLSIVFTLLYFTFVAPFKLPGIRVVLLACILLGLILGGL
jgi:hypothetical protein